MIDKNYEWSYSRCRINVIERTQTQSYGWEVNVFTPYARLLATKKFNRELDALLWANRTIDEYYSLVYGGSRARL